jgi:hypothetical protein
MYGTSNIKFDVFSITMHCITIFTPESILCRLRRRVRVRVRVCNLVTDVCAEYHLAAPQLIACNAHSYMLVYFWTLVLSLTFSSQPAKCFISQIEYIFICTREKTRLGCIWRASFYVCVPRVVFCTNTPCVAYWIEKRRDRFLHCLALVDAMQMDFLHRKQGSGGVWKESV